MAVVNPTAQMNPMMAMMGPDIAKQQYDLAQNQRYADILMQQALMEQPQGQMVSGHYVPPSPIQGLGQLLKAYVARRSSDLIPEKQAQLANAQMQQTQRMFGIGGANPAQAANMALAGGAMQGDVGPTNTNAARMQGVQTGTGSAMPIPAGMDARTAMMQYMINPQAYATALATHSAPTEVQKIAAASGFAPGSPQYQALMRSNLFKQNYIAPTTVAEGGALVPAGSNMPTYIAPKSGIQTQISPTGQFTSSVIPGYAGATGAIEQAQAYGKGVGQAQTTPAQVLDTNTGQMRGATQAEVMGLPKTGVGGGTTPPTERPVVAENPTITATNTEINKNWLTNDLAPVQQAGRVASSTLENVKILKGLDFNTGFGTEAKLAGANLLAALGVKDPEKFATSGQIFQSKVYESLVDTLSKQKGPQTEKDFQNIQKTYAQLKNTPQANAFLFDVAEAKAMQDQRKAQYYEKAVSNEKIRRNLPQINTEWGKISGSIFDLPIQGKDGSVYTLAQKYGIR